MNTLSSQTKRDILSFFLTFLLYLPLILWANSSISLLADSKNKIDNTLSLNLKSFHKEECVVPIAPQKPIEEPVEEPVEEIVPKEPIVEESIVKPEKILSKKPKPIVSKPKKLKKKKATKKRAPRPKRKLKNSSSSGNNKFIARLKAKINANKTYPTLARKRGMEGDICVRFKITPSGKLSALSATGPRVFINSAKNAVNRAFPISTQGASLPMSISLTLNYKFKK